MKTKNRHNLALLSIVVFTLFMVGCASSAEGEVTKSPTTNLELSVQQTLTHAAPPESGESGDSESTAVPAEVTAVDCDLPLAVNQDWPVVLCETFDDNSNGWQVESQDNPYAQYSIAVQNGQYELNYNAKAFAGFQRSSLSWFDVASADDFALTVTTLMNSDFQGCSWGVAFRADEDSFFLFSIYNDNTYAFEIYEDDGWIPLITQRVFDGIRPNQENKLDILAEGGDFTFYINDELVNTFSGGLLQEDGILLIASAKEGVSADYFFDNILLKVRP